jgi:hypothetical protein
MASPVFEWRIALIVAMVGAALGVSISAGLMADSRPASPPGPAIGHVHLLPNFGVIVPGSRPTPPP